MSIYEIYTQIELSLLLQLRRFKLKIFLISDDVDDVEVLDVVE